MKFYTVLLPSLLLIACGSRPAPPVAQQESPAVQQPAPGGAAPPVVVAQQPYPAATDTPAAAQAQPAALSAADQAPQPEIAIPSGTPLHVRLNQSLDTRRNRSGDKFTASLTTAIQDRGRVLVPKGTIFTGHITTSSGSGRMKGRAVMALTLDSFEINGARYPVVTTKTSRASASHKKRNLVLIGGGSGLGALIGGLAGGGKGALIGGGAGAAAGTAGAAATGKKDVSLPAETLLTFRLEENVEL